MSKSVRTLLWPAIVLLLTACAQQGALMIAGSSCMAPPRVDCPEGGCGEQFAPPGEAVDPLTGRHFYLDYPCDLRPGEKLTFILSLHGGGSIGNWQRHYFPAVDYVEPYRLVVATPSGVVRAWQPDNDDAHLHNIVNLVYEQFGLENIQSFWLAGHSQGGMTSNRLVCTPFFANKVDGWLSLSGGRIGPAPVASIFSGFTPPADNPDAPRPGAAHTPDCDISYIFTTGELEITDLPDTSPWADKYHCNVRVREQDTVDTRAGYVTATDQSRGPAWGRNARPGTAQFWVYPNCDGGKLVADVLRLDKGHTEGLEPRVTEELIRMMVAAPGGNALRNRQ